jgi:LTXXQ motif family protein
MRRRAVILFFLLAASTAPVSDAAHAQLSPQGILGGITRPFRQMLGGLGHYPHARRHHGAAPGHRTAAASPGREGSANPEVSLGQVGPPAWPTAYEEVVGFALWPDDYAARIRGRGFDVIADTIVGRFDLPRSSVRTATTGTAAKNDGDNGGVNIQCRDSGNAADNWPAIRLEQILQLSNAQHDALEKVQSTAGQSINGLKGACQNAGALAPPDRLRALVRMLWMVRDGGISLRAPLKQFYDTLTSAQKVSLGGQPILASAQSQPKAADPAANKQYQACASTNLESAERLIKEIEMKVRPNNDQAASLENLHKVSSDMAKLLIASCAQPIPSEPLARLDAADDQLTAMNYAATNVQIALDDFYGKLSDAQKARFDSSNR